MNDNAPLFNQSEFSVTVLEGAQIGDSFAVISAADADEGNNAKVMANGYFKLGHKPQIFVINHISSVLN